MFRVILAIWLAILLAVSLAPDAVKYELGTKGGFHDVGHLIAFVLTGALFCWKAVNRRAKLLGAFGACCFAIGLEALEALIYRNHFEWSDLWIDSLGVILGLAIVALLQGTKTPAWFVRK